jgi:hypothetical protein
MMARMGGDPLVVLEFLRDSFGIGRISQAEADKGSPYIPIGEICDRLAYTIKTQTNNENYYVDIIAMKR